MAMYVFIDNEEKRKGLPNSTTAFKTLDELNEKLPDGYAFAKFCEENNHSGITFPTEGIWYSFDDSSNNFHIVPDVTVVHGYIEACKRSFDEIKKTIKLLLKDRNLNYAVWRNCRVSPACESHKYRIVNSCTEKPYQYLISFNRLWCDACSCIHNNFGQVQFMRYPKDKQINFFKDERFVLMYPASGKNGEGCFDADSGRLSYNAPFTINACSQAIAKAFAEFIDLCEIMDQKKEKSDTTPK